MIVQLKAVDGVGQHRIDTAAKRLKAKWDGTSWVVTDLPAPQACMGRMHVRPATEAATDWLGFWMDQKSDPHLRIIPIASES
jgi:hypothetical protein